MIITWPRRWIWCGAESIQNKTNQNDRGAVSKQWGGIAVGLVVGDSVGLDFRQTDAQLACIAFCLLACFACIWHLLLTLLPPHILDGYCVAIHTIIFTNTHTHHFSCYYDVFNTLVKVAAAAPETLRRLHNSSSNHIGAKESVATKAAAASE